MVPLSRKRLVWIVGGIVLVLAAGLAAIYTTQLRGYLPRWLGGKSKLDAIATGAEDGGPVRYFRDEAGNEGLRLTESAVRGLNIKRKPVKPATKRALAPQPGTVNYDNDRLFQIRSRFPGEVVEVEITKDTDNGNGSATPNRFRPLRYGDKFEQGKLLAVVMSKDLGQAKAALVDAVVQLRLSNELYKLQKDAFYDAALSRASLMLTERQTKGDENTRLNAIRLLRMWKITPKEIEEIEKEANILMDQKKVRSAEDELRWARVEIRVPKMTYRDPSDPKRIIELAPNTELTLVEKNTHVNDMVDPNAPVPLFKLADLSRLKVWVQPPEEYLSLLREQIKKGTPKWDISFQAYPDSKPLHLDILQIAPAIDPNMRTPLVIGYLPNVDHKYLVGQFVTATIYVDPEPDTVEVPTSAINEVDGESLVFIEANAKEHKFVLRRVAVVQRFKDVSYVRSQLKEPEKDARCTLTLNTFEKLREAGVRPDVLTRLEPLKDKKFRSRNSLVKSLGEVLTKPERDEYKTLVYQVAEKERETQPLSVREIVLTRGVVELTAALESHAVKARTETPTQKK